MYGNMRKNGATWCVTGLSGARLSLAARAAALRGGAVAGALRGRPRGAGAPMALAAAVWVLLACGLASGKIIYVDDDAPGDPGPGNPAVSDPLEDGSAEHPFDAVQQGMYEAAAGDTVLMADGVYTGTGNKDLDFAGRAITVRSASGDPATCIIDCQGAGSGLVFDSSETAATVVSGVTIRNGQPSGVICFGQCSPTLVNCTITGNTASTGGGGVLCAGASPMLINCTISGNTAAYGGGVYCTSGAGPKLVNCTISANTVSGSSWAHGGGGLYCEGKANPTLWNCTISGNTAASYGGGVCSYEQSGPTLTDCTISRNSARSGGGVYCMSSIVALIGCEIEENAATDHTNGGGLYCDSGSLMLTRCAISGNRATYYYGGGVYCQNGSSLTLSNCTIAANTAPEAGGGLYLYRTSRAELINCDISANTARSSGAGVCSDYDSSVTLVSCLISGNSGGGVYIRGYPASELINCTISGNTGTSGGGVYSTSTNLKLTNCILWGNTTPELYVYSGAPVVTYCDIRGGYPGVGNLDLDPRFLDPDGPDDDPSTWQDNDYRLAGDSPCIDAGNNAAVPADTLDLDGDYDTVEPLPVDLDGRARFVDVPGWPDTGAGTPPIVDMGAYEVWVVRGDVNCDGGVDFDDIHPFILALGSHEAYGLTYPGCPYESADTNGDGYVDFDDIGPFVRCLAHDGCAN